MNLFWLVWNPTGGVPTFRHPTRDSAKAEANRLAKANPNKEFFVLLSVGVACKVGSIWTDMDADLPS